MKFKPFLNESFVVENLNNIFAFEFNESFLAFENYLLT
jgi:hypothetical protein